MCSRSGPVEMKEHSVWVISDRYLQIVSCLRRQIIVVPHACRRTLPAGDRLVDRFDGFQDLDLRRKFLELAAPVVISRTDQYLFEFVQDIQLGDHDGLQVVQDGRIEGRNPIEPSATAGSAR